MLLRAFVTLLYFNDIGLKCGCHQEQSVELQPNFIDNLHHCIYKSINMCKIFAQGHAGARFSGCAEEQGSRNGAKQGRYIYVS